MRRATSILLLIALAVSAIPATITVRAIDTIGEATIEEAKVSVLAVPPTVSFAFYSDNTYSTQIKEFTPQTSVYMKISVSTDNLLSDIVIDVQLFADTDATAVGTPPATTDPATYVKFTISYDSVGGQWVLDVDTGGSTTWSIDFDPDQTQPSPDATSGDFYIVIVPGKVAAEAKSDGTADYADWDCIVTATSGGTASTQVSDYGYTMYFYSEVSTPAVGIDFGSLEPGASGPIQQVKTGGEYQPANSFSITVIANGKYSVVLTSESTWYHTDGVHYITLTTGTPGTGQFALYADDEEDPNNQGLPANPHVVSSSLATSEGILETIPTRTTEAGVTYNIYMQIVLGTGIAVGTYTGSVTVTVTDAT